MGVSMEREFANRFDRLERLRSELTEALASLGEGRARWKPGPDEWSLGQIAEHLALSGETVGHPSPDPPAEPFPLRLLPRALRRSMLIAAFDRDMALPLPSPTLNPGEATPLSESLARWEIAHETMRHDLESSDVGCLRYSHSILGPLDARQMLDVAVAHTAYHVRQARRVLTRLPSHSEG